MSNTDTTLMIKTNKALRDDAKRVASALGVPLTTVINAYLKQFVRERQITVSLEPRPTAKKLAEWEATIKEADKEKNPKYYTDVEELLRDLKLV